MTVQLTIPGRRPEQGGATPGRLATMALQAVRYSVVGTAGTAVYIGLYLLLDVWFPPIIGNGIAWIVTTLATNGIQRRVAFGVPDGDHAGVDRVVGLVSSAVALLATTLALGALSKAGAGDQVAALIIVNASVGTARFLTVRWWFGRRGREPLAGLTSGSAAVVEQGAIDRTGLSPINETGTEVAAASPSAMTQPSFRAGRCRFQSRLAGRRAPGHTGRARAGGHSRSL